MGGDLVVREVGPMKTNSRPGMKRSRNRDLDGGATSHPPKRRGGPVAQNSAPAAEQDRGHPASVAGEEAEPDG